MNNNYYMLEQMTSSITAGRKQDANAYRLWKRATQALRHSDKVASAADSTNSR